MPTVKPKEKLNDWMNRCIPYVIKNEGLSKDHAVGKCGGMYEAARKRRAKQKRKK